MSDKKRKASSASADKEARAKRQKPAPVKDGKERVAGWLQSSVTQQRTDKKDVKFNTKRLRFISDTQKVKQGSEGVLYWMLRDQRVQGNHQAQPAVLLCIVSASPLMTSMRCVFR